MEKLSKESSFLKKISKLEVDLKGQIKKKLLKPGECILSEHQLSEAYQISRPSVRKVLQRHLRFGVPPDCVAIYLSEPVYLLF